MEITIDSMQGYVNTQFLTNSENFPKKIGLENTEWSLLIPGWQDCGEFAYKPKMKYSGLFHVSGQKFIVRPTIVKAVIGSTLDSNEIDSLQFYDSFGNGISTTINYEIDNDSNPLILIGNENYLAKRKVLGLLPSYTENGIPLQSLTPKKIQLKGKTPFYLMTILEEVDNDSIPTITHEYHLLAKISKLGEWVDLSKWSHPLSHFGKVSGSYSYESYDSTSLTKEYEAYPEIYWMGDLTGNGIVDLLVKSSNNHQGGAFVRVIDLYIGEENSVGETKFRKVAWVKSIGCN